MRAHKRSEDARAPTCAPDLRKHVTAQIGRCLQCSDLHDLGNHA